MDQSEQIALLTQRVIEWNKWRKSDPNQKINLNGTDLSGTILREAYLSGIDLRRAILRGTNLRRADLSGADLRGADLSWADLNRTILNGANLSGAILIGADLSGAILNEADLSKADLRKANLSGAILSSVDLGRADLSTAVLRRANLSEAILKEADLSGAQFIDTYLSKANLTNAIIGNTIFATVDLSDIVGIDTIAHLAPSTIGIETIYKSRGKISEGFLLRSGVPDIFITYMKSLTNTVIEFHSCFISYAENDDTFSERLYNDLVGTGVRCWRWKEDAPWGDKLWKSIDEAIPIYDKLVVICSKASLQNPHVIREMERAIALEARIQENGEDRSVLFPIRLDGAVFTWDHFLANDLTSRYIGDFEGVGNLRGSRQKEKYQKSLKRLVADLKKTSTLSS